ncbi:MAG: hypothetical protein WCI23_07675 [Chlorobiaceae bacterium]
MGNYFIDITDDAKEDIRYWHKVGDKVILQKIKCILLELSDHPTTGTGKVELQGVGQEDSTSNIV